MGQLEQMSELAAPEPMYGSSNKEPLIKKYNIPIQHFEFSYIEECTDSRELEKIMQVLKSGEEGYYPHLISKVEEQLNKIKPNSRYIRKLSRVLSKNEIDEECSNEINEDLTSWLNDINKKNTELSQLKNTTKLCVPEVRKVNENNYVKKENMAKRISSTDYAAWDKYDADTEILKMDLEDEKMKKEAEEKAKEKHRKRVVKFNEFSTSAEAAFEAQRENAIANEYFKAGEYGNALEHYNNSITYLPSGTTYANRGLTYLSLKNYEKAITDYQIALKYEPKHEYILQLGKCYQSLEMWAEALDCAETVIKIDPNNEDAQKLAEKVKKSGEKIVTNKVRFKIVDVETKPIKMTKKSVLKKEVEKPEIIPIPGSSSMSGPYYKVVHSRDPNVINKEKQMINNYPKRIFMTNIDITSDDDCECVETHILPSNSLIEKNNCSSDNSICNKDITTELKCENKKKYSRTETDQKVINELLEVSSVEVNSKARMTEENEKKITLSRTPEDRNTRDINEIQNMERRSSVHQSNFQNETIISEEGNNQNISNEPLKLIEVTSGEMNSKGYTIEHKEVTFSRTSEDSSTINQAEEPIDDNMRGGNEIQTKDTRNRIYQPSSQNETIMMRNINYNETDYNDIGGGGEPCSNNSRTEVNLPEVNMPFRFLQAWQSARRDVTYLGFTSILRNLNADRITEVIGNKIDATILSEILNCLYRHFMVANEIETVYNILANLCRVERFGIVIMFLSNNDKRLVQNLLDFLKQHGRDLPQDIKSEYM